MSEIEIFNLIMIFFSIVGAGVFILLFFVSAPYGQHIRKGCLDYISCFQHIQDISPVKAPRKTAVDSVFS